MPAIWVTEDSNLSGVKPDPPSEELMAGVECGAAPIKNRQSEIENDYGWRVGRPAPAQRR